MESEKLEPEQPKEEIPEFKTLDEWLEYYKLQKYHESFLKHGFDYINYIGEDIIDDKDMTTLKIDSKDPIDSIVSIGSRTSMDSFDLSLIHI